MNTRNITYDNIKLYHDRDIQKTYIKDYKRDEHSIKPRYGLTLEEIYNLELQCLQRVKDLPYMCQLVSYDEKLLTFELAWAGNTVEKIYRDRLEGISKEDFIMQFNNMFELLEQCNIIHLDLCPNNICIENNKITIIDFGSVIIDNNPISKRYHKLYEKFINEGSYDFQKKSTLESMLKFIRSSSTKNIQK